MVDMATGAPAEGYVTLYVRGSINALNSAARTRRGAFRFDDLPPGPAIVVAHADGFAPYFGTLNVDAGKGQSTRIGLLLEAVAGGLVVDSNEDPVEGARVRIGYDRLLPDHRDPRRYRFPRRPSSMNGDDIVGGWRSSGHSGGGLTDSPSVRVPGGGGSGEGSRCSTTR